MKPKICVMDKLCLISTRKKAYKYLIVSLLLFFTFQFPTVQAQNPQRLEGSVIDSGNSQFLVGATITFRGKVVGQTRNDGSFDFKTADTSGNFSVSYIGYISAHVIFGQYKHGPFRITLSPNQNTLNEVVVSTGYQTVPKERTSGSFDQIDNKVINRSTGSNIIDRLNGVTSGLRFNNDANPNVATGSADRYLGINIRGVSTLSGNVTTDPLIVLDNFPYEGNISNINPNDIESITVLKDAAASSIWGARSGNGVIVITTKKGRKNQKLSIELNSTVTFLNKPNLFYDRKYLPSSDYIDLEANLYKKGYFDNWTTDTYDQPAVSPVIDLLAAAQASTITSAQANAQINSLRSLDVRNDYEKYIYRSTATQQYSVGLRGGNDQNAYTMSVGYDNDPSQLVRNEFNRITVNAQNTYTPISILSITTGINYSRNNTALNNNLSYGSGIAVGGPISGIYPYAQFANASGNHLPIVKDYRQSYVAGALDNGLLDWSYRPLDELALADNTTKVNDLILNVGATYKFLKHWSMSLQYQNENQVVENRNYESQGTYAARNLINEFTIITPGAAPTYQVPEGGILNLVHNQLTSNNIRGQINYDQTFGGKNEIIGLIGAELRQLTNTGYTRNSLGYNDEFGTSNEVLDFYDYLHINPGGDNSIPAPDGSVTGTTNRYISYFSNIAYTYNDKYTFTLSGRKDGSNIFGVKTNDRVTPLWSAGGVWDVSKEDFYKFGWLPRMRLRATYGYNGNVYNGSAYVTGNYSTSSLTGTPAIYNLTAPNPLLSWEKVKNINFGLDLATRNNRVSATIEYFIKDGTDLIENVPLYTSTGFLSFYGNAASTSTKGLDIFLTTRNIVGKFQWITNVLFSTLNDKVTKYDEPLTNTTIQSSYGVPIIGHSINSIFSYKWAGLDPSNGDPQGYLFGKVSKDYTSIINNYNPDSLKYNGSSRPTIYGSLRNDFSYQGFTLSANIGFEFGYVIRRPSTSLNAADIISVSGSQNIDYQQRWQKSGDENMTSVPSIVYPSNTNRNTFYQYSSTLVTNADNIRLSDIRLAYELNKKNIPALPFQKIEVFGYASNLGIIWRANKYGIDPDLSPSNPHPVPTPFTLALGFNAIF
jgi:TonB-linked SusC/RagA family outer membrane protein